MSAKQCQILAALGLDKNVTLQSIILEGKTAMVGACLDDTDEDKKARFDVGQDVEETLLKAEGPVLIQDRGACAIANVLKHNNTLKELHLIACEITDVGATCIGNALEKNRGIVALHLDHNRIGVNGAACIFAALRTNGVLADLRLRGNRIEDDGAMELASVFNPSLRSETKAFSVKHGDPGRAPDRDASNHKILQIEDDEAEDTPVSNVSGIVPCSLTHIDLSLNQITDVGAVALVHSLGERHKLQYLDMSGRDFDLWVKFYFVNAFYD
jgi:hypothetical protein